MICQTGSDAKEIPEGVRQILRIAAEQGNVEAQCKLGWRLQYTGEDEYAPDRVERMRRWATIGEFLCQTVLAEMYATGKGVPKDLAEAVKWYRFAAAQRDSMAEFQLGRMYSRGEGVRKNRAVAAKWYKRAA